MVKNIILAKPRGFCAGVERAIKIVELALEKYGPPIYVRHEIVHNRYVVNKLQSKGAVFVDNLDQVPKNNLVIFSAHGVSAEVEAEAKFIGLQVLDATCPLVKKVHQQVQKYEGDNRIIILIGHNNHPEIEGTRGRVKARVYIVENLEDIANLDLPKNTPISYATQTTLSLDDTAFMIQALYNKFDDIQGPKLSDICYATQNRQKAVKALAAKSDTILVVGSKNSSNSNRLKDLGESYGIASYLINDETEIELNTLGNNIGITAGASAPEKVVQNVVEFLLKTYPEAKVNEMEGIDENIKFPLPHSIR